jgi:hypothetical protein
MRKIGLLVAALAIVAVCVPAAFADISFPGAVPVWGHLSDWSSLYRNGIPYREDSPNLGIPAPGDEGRALAYINQFYDADSGDVYWTPGVEELTALEYDYIIPGGDAYVWMDPDGPIGPQGMQYVQQSVGTGGVLPTGDLYFIPGPEYGGRIDVWLDSSPDWADPDGAGPLLDVWESGPTAWIRPGDAYVDPHLGAITPDDYPGASDLDRDGVSTDPSVSLWLTGTYAPLFSDDNLNSVRDPWEMNTAWFDQAPYGGGGTAGVYDPGIDPVAVYGITSWTTGGLGTANAWIDFDGGTFFPLIQQDALGPGYDLSLQANLHPSLYGDRGTWGTRSSDPTYMEVIPEPTSLALLGLGIVGLVGRVRRRWRK